jgi:hypothetical protein
VALYDEPRDSELYALTVAAILGCNERVRDLEATGGYISKHFNFPTIRANAFAQTFPSIDHFGTDGPTDYGSPFALNEQSIFGKKISYSDVPALASLIDYVRNNAELRTRLTHGLDLQNDDYTAISSALFPLGLLVSFPRLCGHRT